MRELTKYLFIIAFFVSVVYLPWWLSALIALLLLSVWRAYVSVIVGALCMDILFGSPLVAFGGFAYLYTAIFSILALMTLVLNRAMLE